MKTEMIGMVHSAGCGKPGKQGHGDHDAFLNSLRPSKIPAQHGCCHHSDQIYKIETTLDMKASPRLDLLGESPRSFDILLDEHVLLINIEYDEQRTDDECPLRQQPQGPLKWHTAQESKKQRR